MICSYQLLARGTMRGTKKNGISCEIHTTSTPRFLATAITVFRLPKSIPTTDILYNYSKVVTNDVVSIRKRARWKVLKRT